MKDASLSDNDWNIIHEELAKDEFYTYELMHEYLKNLHSHALQQTTPQVAHFFDLLAKACDPKLVLNEDNKNLTSHCPDSEIFSDKDIDFFKNSLPQIHDNRLLAHLADIIWIREKDPVCAEQAFDAYLATPIKANVWYGGGRQLWERLEQLRHRVFRKDTTRSDQVKTKLLDAFDNALPSDTHFAAELAEFMLECQFLNNPQKLRIAYQLEQQAPQISAQSPSDTLYRRDCCYATIGKLYKEANAGEQLSSIIYQRAEAYINAARNQQDFAGILEYVKAQNLLLSIPTPDRKTLNIESLIDNIKLEAETAAKNIPLPHQMTVSLNDDALMQLTFDSIRGSDTESMLHYMLSKYAPIAHIRDTAATNAQQSLTAYAALIVFLDKNNRLIANKDGKFPEISAFEAQAYSIWMTIHTRYHLLPIIGKLRKCPEITQEYFLEKIRQAGIIPENRANSWATGIYEGLHGRYLTAMHILPIQFEYLVRYMLKQKGEVTTTLQNGVSNEISLPSLLEKESIRKILSDNELFEAKLIFCDPRCSNLRHNVAHSLMEDNEYQDFPCAYAWFFLARFALGLRQEESSQPENGN